jgi:hypothetical protein
VHAETQAAIHSELQQALSATAAARHRRPAPDATLQARLLLAVVDGLMLHAVSAPGTLTPAELQAALDAYLDQLLPPDGHP